MKANENVMPAHEKCTKHAFNMLALLTKNYYVLFLVHHYSEATFLL